jgi:hypothetical protein
MFASLSFGVFAVEGIPEVTAGMDLGLVIGDAIASDGPSTSSGTEVSASATHQGASK